MVKKWFVTKTYHCLILKEGCVEAGNVYPKDTGPDCGNCVIYQSWKQEKDTEDSS
jgi:hypothetical protein